MNGSESKGGESGARVSWHSAAIVSDDNKQRPVHSQPNEHLFMRSSHCGHTQADGQWAVCQTNPPVFTCFTSFCHWMIRAEVPLHLQKWFSTDMALGPQNTPG